MGNSQSINDTTRLVQDVQYTAALKGMSSAEKNAYFSKQKQELLDSVTNDRESTFQKTYTDAVRNNSIQSSMLFYQQRNKDVDNLGTELKNVNESALGKVRYNKDLATRQYEMNEWSYNNKLDTLFVFQLLLVTVLLSATLTYLQRSGFFGTPLLGIFIIIMLGIDIAVIINRATYTSTVRDQRYWNRRQFPKYDFLTGPQTVCNSTRPDESAPAPVYPPHK